MLTLEEAKKYLRVDGDEEDSLITDFIQSAVDICEGIMRRSITEFDPVPETINQAILFIVSQFYEFRESINVSELIETSKRLLFAYRKESW